MQWTVVDAGVYGPLGRSVGKFPAVRRTQPSRPSDRLVTAQATSTDPFTGPLLWPTPQNPTAVSRPPTSSTHQCAARNAKAAHP